jgi:subtilisin family serine protease
VGRRAPQFHGRFADIHRVRCPLHVSIDPFRSRRGLLVLLATLVAATGSSVAVAAPESTSVLVKVDSAASLHQRQALGEALGATDEAPLAAGWREYELPGALSAAEVRAALAGVPADIAVELDRPVYITSGVPNDPRVAEQWGLDAVQAPMAWDVPISTAVTVAVIDTGVDLAHPDLAGAAWTNPGEIPANGIDDEGNGYIDDVHGWDFLHGDGSVFDDAAEDAHGTHIAGVIGATRNDGVGIAGVAGNARIMSLKFVGGAGGLASDAIAALAYARSNGARVVNASFGGPYSQALCDAVAEAAAAGTIVVAAAGNDGVDIDGAVRAPAMCPEASVISVGASTSYETLAPFSNRGVAGVDIAAPGEFILSTVPAAGHDSWSGTSMAAPHVSGAAAMVIGQNPSLTPVQVRQTILDSADRLPGLAGTSGTGARLDVARALGAQVSPVPLLSATTPVEAVDLGDEARPGPRKTPARIMRLAASRKTFRVNRSTRLRYRVNAATRVRFTVRRAATGAVVSTFVRQGAEGDNVLFLSARAGRNRPLPPGRYRVVARTPSGQAPTRTVTIEIMPAKRVPAHPTAHSTAVRGNV